MASRRTLATRKRLEDVGIVLLTETEEFKFTNFTLTFTSSNNYAYLYGHVALRVREGLSSGRSRSHVSFHIPFALQLK